MNKATILVVEDNATTRKLVRYTLENKGYHVLEAADGATALEIAHTHHPQLILQDLILPDMDGFDLAKRLRELFAETNVSIIAFSGFVSKVEDARLSQIGFDDVVIKPIEPARLLQIIETNLAYTRKPENFAMGKKVLLADDDPIQLKLVRTKLTHLGFQVLSAVDGKDALEMAVKNVPDVIIADVLMPELDGFGLSLAVRKHTEIAHLPVLLITSSYIEQSDREMARNAGANDLILRTPDLNDLILYLKDIFKGKLLVHPVAPPADIEKQHFEVITKQLDRQVTMNSRLAQRCSALSAELRVLAGISKAVLEHHDLNTALEEVLAACFDAGGIPMGALYLCHSDGSWEVRPILAASTFFKGNQLDKFFNCEHVLREILQQKAMAHFPSETFSPEISTAILTQCQASSVLIAPLVYDEKSIGALFMLSKERNLDEDDWKDFIQSVSSQITVAIALSQAFAQKEESEKNAKDHESLLKLMIDSMAEGVIALDTQNKVLLWNKSAERMTSIRLTELNTTGIDKHYSLFYPDGVNIYPFEKWPLTKAMRGESTYNTELVLKNNIEKVEYTINVNARPLFHEDGSIRGALSVFRDITSDKQTEAQLISSDRMASIGMLASGVAHEINNPLAVVMGNLELAQHDVASLNNAELQNEISDALQASERIRQIVQDLKLFSKHKDWHTKALDVHAVIESTLRLAHNEIRHRANLVKNFGENYYIEGNEARLGQLFLNLIVNAAQAIPEGQAQNHEINISTEEQGGYIVITIRDTGIGMSQETLSRLYTPFFTTKPMGKGTGLGLTISKRIVDSMDGDLKIQSEVGKGTSVKIILPKTAAAQQSVNTFNLQSLPPMHVLVIDDEPMIVDFIERTLGEKHTVTTMTQPQLVIERLKKGERFDLIFCDLMMPHMTGMDLFEAIQKLNQDQANKMIFITGGAFTPRAQEFITNDKHFILEKPFKTDELLQAIGKKLS